MRCLIIDDEEISRTSLQILCEKISDLEVIGSCANAMEGMELLRKRQVDLLFLDVEMPGLTGMDLLRSYDELPYVIFITGREAYAAEAFEYKERIADFVTKPVQLPRLVKAVERARRAIGKPALTDVSNSIFVKSDKRLVRIDLNDLLYIETIGDYVLFKTTGGQYVVHATLKSIDERLCHPDFLKVHRSYIVNLSKIVDVEENSLLIKDKIIPVSRSNKPVLLRKINPI